MLGFVDAALKRGTAVVQVESVYVLSIPQKSWTL